MPAYLIVHRRKITDAEHLKSYDNVEATIGKFGGKVLIRSDEFLVLEGQWHSGNSSDDARPERVTVIEFPDMRSCVAGTIHRITRSSKISARRTRPRISSRLKARSTESAAPLVFLPYWTPGAKPGSAALCARVLAEHCRLLLLSTGVAAPFGAGTSVAAAGLITPLVAARWGAGAQGGGSRKSGAFIGGLGSCGPGDGVLFGDCAAAAVIHPKLVSARTRARFMIALLFLSTSHRKKTNSFGRQRKWRAERSPALCVQPDLAAEKVT